MIQSWSALREAIAGEFARNPARFLREPTITQTLHPNQPALARLYCADLQATTHGQGLLSNAREPDYGTPRRDAEAGGCSMVAVQHAWQLSQLWSHLAVTPRDLNCVAEIGAGYGDMCRQIHAAGFSGRYMVSDFSELREIQRQYLARCGVARTQALALDAQDDDPGPNSLLLATFSVSEMPLELRAEIEPRFMGYGYLMFSWNESFAGIDNMTWFQGLAARLAGHYKVDVVKDPHMRAWYLFGKSRR